MAVAPTLMLAAGSSQASAALRDRERLVLSELARDAQAQVAFQGLRRRLGLHPQALVRTLRSLESLGYIRRESDGYRLAAPGAEALGARPAPLPPTLRPVFAAVLPNHVTSDRIVEKLARRWFNGLRWYGVVATPREQVLTWLTEADGSVVQLRLADGMLGLEAEKPREDAGFGLVGPLMEAIAAFYAAPRDRPAELPSGAPRPAG
ncbi:MAG: MarR family transcriptional regulator [Euryarchaeota archaeon]|nr:MarR family transcriptional regulator [Euryarchaeota archaeon]